MSETAETSAALRLLIGADADEMLRTAVEAMGGRLDGWTLSQVDHRPATGTTTAYAARVSWPDGLRAETLGAHLAARPETYRENGSGESVPGVVAVSDGEHQVPVAGRSRVARPGLPPAIRWPSQVCSARSASTRAA